jgi:ERCC4-type nuclease
MIAVKVVTDFREKPSGVPIFLKQLGAIVTYRNLSVGDYILSNGYAVERKGVGDFLSSMLSGRLFDQAYRLTEAYRVPILIVEGDFYDMLEEFRTPRALWGALASLSIRYGEHVFYTEDTRQTAELIYVLSRQASYPKHPEPVVSERRKIETLAERQLHIVSSLPGVGLRLADRLLSRFGSVGRIFQASSLELASVRRFGHVKAGKIRDLLDSTYKPQTGLFLQKTLDEG